MAPKIFITGITGYIGGTVANHLIKAHPEYEVTAIVRTNEQASKVKAAYKTVRTVLGDLDSSDIVSKESAAADVVIHTANADHVNGATTITEGIRKASGSKPGYLIHTSGTGILVDQSVDPGTYHSKVYDDVNDIKALTSLPTDRAHRDVDIIVLDSSSKTNASRGIRTAIISPPTIYGTGTGPVKVRSVQKPRLVTSILKNKGGYTLNEGKNVWRNVHVEDLADAYVLLTEQALQNGGNASWNDQGYYFTENGEHSIGELSRLITLYAFTKGYIKTVDVPSLQIETVEKLELWSWGSNSRGLSTRFKTLGWKPYRPPIAELIPEAVEFEVKSQG